MSDLFICLFLQNSISPQLYRGYIYSLVGDEVCYYLGSRFYSPKLGRFLNADKHFDTGTGVLGTNMYAYCNNNPVMYVDPTGESINVAMKLTNLFVKVVSLLSVSINSLKRNKIAIQILKDLDIYPYYMVNKKKIYETYTIKKTEGMSEQIFTIYMSLNNKYRYIPLYIDATFEERTIAEWEQYVAQSILDLLVNDSVLFATVASFFDEFGPIFSFLSECADGTPQTVAFYLDIVGQVLEIMGHLKVSKQKYIIEQLEQFGDDPNPNEKMIVLLYYYKYFPYEANSKKIIYMY